MSEAISQPELQAEQPPAEFQRPGNEEFFEGAVPDPHDVAIEDINPMSGRLFSEDKHWGFFERLRNEDPVHFNTFLSAANQCDYIFTTDIDCISEYKKKLFHQNIYLLPFAANLYQTNPIISSKRNEGACFAGAYYARYLERAKNLSSMISAISQKMPLDI